MQHFVLTYRYVDDYMARRDAYRAEHLARLQKAVDDGFVLAVGVLPESLSALIVCYANSADEVRAFAKDDPYNHAGLITSLKLSPGWWPSDCPRSSSRNDCRRRSSPAIAASGRRLFNSAPHQGRLESSGIDSHRRRNSFHQTLSVRSRLSGSQGQRRRGDFALRDLAPQCLSVGKTAQSG